MTRWAMVVDLTRCIGCESCVTSCKTLHRIPSNKWRRVIDGGDSPFSKRQRLLVHQSCMHCSDPSCMDVCPTKATYQRSDGIIAIDYKKCVGCGSCILACPYHVRHIFTEEDLLQGEDGMPKTDGMVENDTSGVCSKCTFCYSRIDEGIHAGLYPGKDDEATPLCVTVCSSGALSFGDLDDPDSTVNDLIQNQLTSQMQEQMSTSPSVFFIVPDWWKDCCADKDSGERD